MSRQSPMRSILAIAMMLVLAMSAVLPVSAQDDESPVEDDVPAVEQPVETQYGTLQISAVTCTGDGEAGSVAILLSNEYASSGECADGASALLIDGVDYGSVAPYLEVQLEVGTHSLYEPDSGAARDIDIAPDGATAVVIVRFTVSPEPTEEPAVEAASETTGEVLIVAHACKPDVQSVDQLFALGDRIARLNACPALTLPGYPAPGGAISGGELSFDFMLAPIAGDAQTLTGNGAFVPDSFCESSIGPLDNDPTNDRCVSTSGFSFELPEGSITFTQTLAPEAMRYVAAETGSDADAGIITGSDPDAGYLGLDTAQRGTDRPTIHLYYLNPPRVNVLVHLCSPDIASPDDLAALGSLAAQLLACPATARSAEGGAVDFAVTVTDANWGPRGLDSAIFDPTVICESDIGDWDGNGGNAICLDAPTYRFDRTAMGSVAVWHNELPAGYAFGGANSDDATAIVSVDLASATIALDTSYDGDVTLHLFDLVASQPATVTPTVTATRTKTPPPPTATRTPMPSSPTATATLAPPTRTATPLSPTMTPAATTATASTGAGTLIVAALYCLSGSGATLVALPPGQQASAADLGGSGCFSGDATIHLTLADGNAIPALKLGRDGVESIQNIPVTGASSHTVTEGLTSTSASFEIAPGTITRVIVRYGAGMAMVDEGVDAAGGASVGKPGDPSGSGGLVTDDLIGDAGVSTSAGSYSGVSFTSLVIENVDAQAVASIEDAKSLPNVGARPMKPVQQYAALLVLGLLLAVGAAGARRSGHGAR